MNNWSSAHIHGDTTSLRAVKEGAEARNGRAHDAPSQKLTPLEHRCADQPRRVVTLGPYLERALGSGRSRLRQQRRQSALEQTDIQLNVAIQMRMHPLLQRQRVEPDRERHASGPLRYLRAIFGTTVIASILSLAAGCDKRAGGDAKESAHTSLANRPRTLFFLFGDKSDPRVLPLATLVGGKITPISLDAAGWRNFDQLYFTVGATLPLYQGGSSVGDAVVRRGMWTGDDALYKLPGCRALRPLAAVTLSGTPNSAVMLELLATSEALPPAPVRPAPTVADSDSAAALATRVGQREGLTNTARSELDRVLNVLPTGATAHPTLLGSFMERGSGLNGKPRHVFIMGDYSDSTKKYVQSFVHVPVDSLREFRRLIDHADLTGDGIDEVVLEGWRSGGDSFLVFMQYQNGRWREVARGATSWCADPVKT